MALALWILALTELPGDHERADGGLLGELTGQLLDAHYLANRSADWEWFAPEWSPGAARLATALWHAADALDDAALYRVARSTTDFVIDQLFEDGLFLPVGSGGWKRSEEKAIFDQHPLEAGTVTELLSTAERATANVRYGQFAEYAYRWFHGNNIRGQELTRADTGACYDAIRRQGTDTNQNARATLAHLLAHDCIALRQSLAVRADLTVAVAE